MLAVLPVVLSKLNLRDRGRTMQVLSVSPRRQKHSAKVLSRSQVCRAWRAAARESALWRDVDLRTHRITPALVSAFSSWCGALEHLRVGGRDNALQACRLRAPALRALRCAFGCLPPFLALRRLTAAFAAWTTLSLKALPL